ncbi:MAG: hypothetical protein KKB30_10600, partial [Proteobacteria bacterium]|nr:hypothetical protein [Pseudomonadota bacterium]MBU1715016.1 hypothetical protein [Pseudomonadota bacterium]
KLFSADGTAWETMWESRSPPNLFLIPPFLYWDGGIFLPKTRCPSFLADLSLISIPDCFERVFSSFWKDVAASG